MEQKQSILSQQNSTQDSLFVRSAYEPCEITSSTSPLPSPSCSCTDPAPSSSASALSTAETVLKIILLTFTILLFTYLIFLYRANYLIIKAAINQEDSTFEDLYVFLIIFTIGHAYVLVLGFVVYLAISGKFIQTMVIVGAAAFAFCLVVGIIALIWIFKNLSTGIGAALIIDLVLVFLVAGLALSAWIVHSNRMLKCTMPYRIIE